MVLWTPAGRSRLPGLRFMGGTTAAAGGERANSDNSDKPDLISIAEADEDEVPDLIPLRDDLEAAM